MEFSNSLFLASDTAWGRMARTRLQGENSPLPAGMAIKACHSFKIVDSNSGNGMSAPLRRAVLIHFCKRRRRKSRFVLSSCMVLGPGLPLNSNPNRSCCKACFPSPWHSFLYEIESSVGSLLAGKTSWIPVKTAVATCSSCACDVAMANGIKSSTYTSTKYLSLSSLFFFGSCCTSAPVMASVMNLWGCRAPTGLSMYWVLTSRAVSDAAQKNGGDSTQPICSDVGTTSCTSFPGSCGNTYEKFHSSPSWQSSRQNPSLISYFTKKTLSSSDASAYA